jgi:hypothetical protein
MTPRNLWPGANQLAAQKDIKIEKEPLMQLLKSVAKIIWMCSGTKVSAFLWYQRISAYFEL